MYLLVLFLVAFANPSFAKEDGFGESQSSSKKTVTTQGQEDEDDDDEDEFKDETASSGKSSGTSSATSTKEKGLKFTGFLEIERGGHFNEPSKQEKQWIMDNKRLRLATSGKSSFGQYFLKLDIIDDQVTKKQIINFQEARLKVTPFKSTDISIGRQVSTWGVADMLYINDLFPKNWVANFLGRDMEALKDSSNSFRMTSYFGLSTGIDLVYHPEFTADTTPTGCRFSIYDPNTQALITNTSTCSTTTTNTRQTGEYSHGEFAARFFTRFGSHDFALYTYTGYYKNPKGLQWADSTGDATGNINMTPSSGDTQLISYYPRLNVYGASLEGQLGSGTYSLEVGYYDSREDREGTNAFIENSMWKYLVGYRMTVSANFSFGIQWYQESMQKYTEYEASIIDLIQVSASLTDDLAKEENAFKYRKKQNRNTYTLRLTIKAQQETLWLSAFIYERPEDKDRFVKLEIKKRLDDHYEIVLGANIFDGNENYIDREFAMLRHDDNAFARVKYNF
jgi:hypothetical protein